MPNYLITGREGQLGQCFAAVAEEFPKIKLIFTNQNEVDLIHPETLLNSYNNKPFKGIINCAAYTNVDNAEQESEKAYQINAEGLKNLTVFAEKKGLSLVHFSTDYVFDGVASFPYQEDDKPNPINIYGHSKLYGEQLLEKAKCQHTTFRISWLFSPFGNNFLKVILKLSQIKKTFKVVNDQFGRPTYGIDLARIVLTNIEEPNFFDYNCYHYASRYATTWFDFASKIIAIKKSTCQIKPCSTEEYPALAKRPKYSVLDTKLIENHLSLDMPSWEDSLKRCLKRIDNNEKL